MTTNKSRFNVFTRRLTPMHLSGIWVILFSVLLFVSGCKKDVSDKVPVLTTLPVEGICIEEAISGGEAISDAGDLITEKGLCWSTHPNPTIDDDRSREGEGANRFVSVMSGLKPSTRYYVRAYAVNSHGAGYGEVFSFETHSNLMRDFDDNEYRLKNIGGIVWMMENLKVTHLNDGTPIPEVTVNNDWGNLSTMGRCWYSNNAATYRDLYGALYNWHAVNTGRLCPEGWRVPTDDDWMQVEKSLGMDPVVLDPPGYRGEEVNIGGMMKQTGTTVWNAPNLGATNESGFTGLPGGAREYINGQFGFHKEYGFWWTSTETYPGMAFMRALAYDLTSIFKNHYDMQNGFSVRCVKEDEE